VNAATTPVSFMGKHLDSAVSTVEKSTQTAAQQALKIPPEPAKIGRGIGRRKPSAG
jgi:hypothetical protein